MHPGDVGRKLGGQQTGETDQKFPSPIPPSSGQVNLRYLPWTSYYLKKTGKTVGPVGVTSQGWGGNGERVALKLWWLEDRRVVCLHTPSPAQ